MMHTAPFTPVHWTRPLLTPYTCMSVLPGHCTFQGLLRLIEDGQLRWAFNIGIPGKSKRTIRVWAESLNAYLAGGTPRREDAEADLSRIVNQISPAPVISVQDLANAWNAKTDLVFDLARRGYLKLLKLPCRGCKGSPPVRMTDVARFLRAGRLP